MGPPVETLKIEVVLDATDRLEKPDQNPTTVAEGIAADLAELETMIAPRVADLEAAEAPLLLLVLGANRTIPVRITEFAVTEEAFDTRLNPILARVALGLRGLTTDDLPFTSKGAGLFLTAARRREALAARRGAGVQALGLAGTP